MKMLESNIQKKVEFEPFRGFDPFAMFSSGYEYIAKLMNSTRQKWQLGRGYVYSMSEVNADLFKKFSPLSADMRVRVLQPATDFYQSLIVIWLLFKEKNLDSQSYTSRVQAMFGDRWSDRCLADQSCHACQKLLRDHHAGMAIPGARFDPEFHQPRAPGAQAAMGEQHQPDAEEGGLKSMLI
jgi:hypothetical protein